MGRSERLLYWAVWSLLFASLLVWALAPGLLPPRAHPWHEAETAVAGFVLTLFALVTGVGTFSMRETLVLREAEKGPIANDATGGFWIRTRLVTLWCLCALVGVYGGILSRYSALPATAWPYLIGAAVLFVIHAPRASFLRRICALTGAQARG